MVDKHNYSVHGFDWRITDYWNGRRYNQQEARIMLLPDGESVFVIYTTRFFGNPLPPFTQMYGILRRNASNNEYIAGPPVWIDYERHLHTKNFVPFLYNDSVHLIPSFHPMVIIRLEAATDDGLNPVTLVHHQFNQPDAEGNQQPVTVPAYSLPWKEEYGIHIRGGTPALLVPSKDYYLLFFHTRQHGPAWGVDHYFMGAMTLCPHPPFHIRSMSRYPIVVDPLWYEGAWLNKVRTRD